MNRRVLIVLAAAIVVIAGILAMIPDRDQPGAEGDHATPAVRDPQNPAAPAPSN
ncbi:hypothetical protein [Rhizobium deserti]|uniref:hypothetical protein n=1 Tax=Rhizobium deserti TaxID=2547961 RepID=UPI001386BC7C|nr:hypothetical protein [Rhizobium deserti]